MASRDVASDIRQALPEQEFTRRGVASAVCGFAMEEVEQGRATERGGLGGDGSEELHGRNLCVRVQG